MGFELIAALSLEWPCYKNRLSIIKLLPGKKYRGEQIDSVWHGQAWSFADNMVSLGLVNWRMMP